MKAYKLVRRRHDQLFSAWTSMYFQYYNPNTLSIEYAIGKKSKAKFNKALFAFDSIEAAEKWKNKCGLGPLELYQCNVVKSRSQSIVFIDNGDIDGISKLLRKESVEAYMGKPPEGTIACSSITLLKKV